MAEIPSIEALASAVARNDRDELAHLRGYLAAPEHAFLLSHYWDLTSWGPRQAVMELLRGQHHLDLEAVALDYLRAPVETEEVELTKAHVLGLLGEQYDQVMAYVGDRDLLARTVDEVLAEHGQEVEPVTTPPPSPPPLPTATPHEQLVAGAEANDLEQIQQALARGADVDQPVEGGLRRPGILAGCPPLQVALSEGHVEAAELLVEAGADVNATRTGRPDQDPGRGQTAIWWAALWGRSQIVQLLLDAGAAPDTPDTHGATGVSRAARKGHADIVAMLVEAGADPDGFTHGAPLHGGVRYKHLAVVEYLLGRGVDVEARSEGMTPLLSAAGKGYVDIARALIAHGADIEAQRHQYDGRVVGQGTTPLTEAVRNGFVRMTRLLLDHGADVHHRVATRGAPPDANPPGTVGVLWIAQGKRAASLQKLLREAGAR